MEPNAGGRLKFVEENITKIKPLAYNIFGGILLVSDYDFLKHIFSQRSGSHRLSIHKIKLDFSQNYLPFDLIQFNHLCHLKRI